MNAMDFQAGLPYPQIGRMTRNPCYANILMQSYAGSVSELTAINQYDYIMFVFNLSYPDLAQVFMYISHVEMHHLKMLGEAIAALGGDPVYASGSPRGRIWRADCVSYSRNLCTAIIQSINGEKEAIAQYRRTLELIPDDRIDSIISRIILDEEHHLKIFSELYDKYCCQR